MRSSLRMVFCIYCAVANMEAQSGKLAFLIPNYIDQSLRQVEQSLGSVNPAFAQSVGTALPSLSFASLNTSLATALSNLPVPSPASAFVFRTNRNLGAPVPFSQSLGPILTERAETIGKNRYFFALTYQRFQFDRIDDLDLRGFRIGVAIPISLGPASVEGLVLADNAISLIINQTTAYFTYGLTHRLDVSYAVPIVSSTLGLKVSATFGISALRLSLPLLSGTWAQASSTGLGDQTVRLKGRLLNREKISIALASDFRLPTGDEFNYHGAGAYGIKPFLIASSKFGSISPHFNGGYLWNGSSYLASRTGTEKKRLPSQVVLAGGMDAAITQQLTATFDVLDQVVIHGQRSFAETHTASDGTPYLSPVFPIKTRHEASVAAGFKVLLQRSPAGAPVGRDLVLTANMQFRANQAGLRARVTPLIGISYTFGGYGPP